MNVLPMPSGGFALPKPWRWPLLLLLALQLLLLALFWPTAVAMVGIWESNGDFTHCYVVPPLAGWMIWRLRARLAPLQPQVEPWLLLPLLLLVLLWWVSDQVAMNAGTQLTLVAMMVLAAPLLLGRHIAKVLLFPLFFFIFAVPTGEFMTPYLMDWTAKAVVVGLRWTGVPVLQEGQQLVIPSGRWAVVEACGGIRYLMSTLMVGSLFAYLNYRSTTRRVAFVGLSIVVPILANWLRAYIIVMLGHLSNNTIAVGVDHILYGWVFFGIVVFALFMAGARWSEPDDGSLAPMPGDRPARAPAAWRQSDAGLLVCAVAAGALLLLPRTLLNPPAVDAQAAGRPQLQAPALAASWQPKALPTLDWQPSYHNPSAVLNQAYVGPDGGEVVLNLQYYRHQTYDAKLAAATNILSSSDGAQWNQTAAGRQAVDSTPPSVWNTVFMLRSDLDITLANRPSMAVWQAYWVGGHLTTSRLQARLWQAWLAVTRQPDDAAGIILHAPAATPAQAEARLAAFVADNQGHIHQLLLNTRAQR